MLKRIVTRKLKTSMPQITSEMNAHLQKPVSMKSIERELHAANIHDREAITKPVSQAFGSYIPAPVTGLNSLGSTVMFSMNYQWCNGEFAFSQRSSSPRLIEDETFNGSEIMNNLIDYEDGQDARFFESG
ncbi:hypothetical protein TNCV_2118871 [Trichonephila clavipes]|nr:hypothetical protein TNCV_2118871 [Trichonephila clavipes]